MRLCAALALSGLFALLELPLPQSPTTITLNPSLTYQTITGWEAHVQSGALIENDILGVDKNNPDFAVYSSALYDQAVNNLGINRVRLEIRSGAENPVDYFGQYLSGQITNTAYKPHRYESFNDNGDPNVLNAAGFKWSELDHTVDKTVLPLRQRLAARGERLWVNLCYVDFGATASTFKHKNNAAEYGEFVLATYQHLQTKYGFVPDSWEVILEPDNSAASYTAAQVASMTVAAQNRLLAAGFTPNFVLPSTVSGPAARTWYNNIKAANPAALTYVKEVAYHRYVDIDNALLGQLRDTTQADGKSTAMLEWWSANNSYKTLHKDLKIGNNSSWQQGIFADQYASGTKLYITSGNTFAMREITQFTRQYFSRVRRGAQRIEASSTDSTFDPIAFRNSDGTYAVIVQALAGGSLSIGGLPNGTYGAFYTTGDGFTASAYNVQQPDQVVSNGVLTTSIPGAGVITIYDATPAPTPTPTATPAPSPTPSPASMELMLEENGSVANKAAALDSVLFSRDPFPIVNSADLLNLNADRNTRIILFVLNLPTTQSGSVIVNLVDSNNQSHDIPAEEVRFVPFQAFVQVVFRLSDNMPVGLCQVRVKALGQTTNTGVIRIRI